MRASVLLPAPGGPISSITTGRSGVMELERGPDHPLQVGDDVRLWPLGVHDARARLAPIGLPDRLGSTADIGGRLGRLAPDGRFVVDPQHDEQAVRADS